MTSYKLGLSSHFLLFVLCCFVLRFRTSSAARSSRLDGGRLNFAPKPSVPFVDLPDGLRPSRDGKELPPYDTLYWFDQLIDHSNPGLGTFKQKYLFTWENYQKGGPIILFMPGETNATRYTSYMTNRTLVGMFAIENHGATVILEHRYFGDSNPFENLTSHSLRFQTVDQAIEDVEYFAKHVRLPFPADVEDGSAVGTTKRPWILAGGSYGGALVGWIMSRYPGMFHAGYSSSGVVQAISYFWHYFEIIRHNMPRNCSADVQAVISHVDETLLTGTQAEKEDLRALFGLQNVSHYDDVAGTLRNQLWEWQGLSPTSEGGEFFDFCDALEVKDGEIAGIEGFGLKNALAAWGNWTTNWIPEYCDEDKTQDECFGSYNPEYEYWTNITIGNSYRSWIWMCCHELGYWQSGAPEGWPTLVTRLATTAYEERQCTNYFPDEFITPRSPNVTKVNEKYEGWNINQDRLFFVNGLKDPWRPATVSSYIHPRRSSERQPIYVVDGGYHCSDLAIRNNIDESIKKVQAIASSTMTKWIAEFVPGELLPPPGLPSDNTDIGPVEIPQEILDAKPIVVDVELSAPIPESEHGPGLVDSAPLRNVWARDAMRVPFDV